MVWNLSDGSRTIASIIRAVCEEYDISENEAAADIIEYIDDLIQEDLIILNDHAALCKASTES
ncbi:MAG: Coenzyme PQQ synthesis protein D (PqqD) [Pelotomaculum sp. PtaU1.Bin035]|nr:MAG: Coenzyme PQQ synthesis protein D (PqqD) [Pelotomaculum sp. PtaU1.Bin035]